MVPGTPIGFLAHAWHKGGTHLCGCGVCACGSQVSPSGDHITQVIPPVWLLPLGCFEGKLSPGGAD
jgi:hypothetical protein